MGQHGSIAIVERAIRTLKENLRQIVIPIGREAMRAEVQFLVGWYNEHRRSELSFVVWVLTHTTGCRVD